MIHPQSPNGYSGVLLVLVARRGLYNICFHDVSQFSALFRDAVILLYCLFIHCDRSGTVLRKALSVLLPLSFSVV